MLPTIAGMTDICHHAQHFSTEMGPHKKVAHAGFQPQSSQVGGISHWHNGTEFYLFIYYLFI
jgi:hypothetical protein